MKVNKKIIIPIIVIVLLVIAIILSVFLIKGKNSKITELEESTIVDVSNPSMLYMDMVEGVEADGQDVYVAYALAYSYNENDKESLTIDEIESIVKDVFNIKLDKEKLKEGIITPALAENFISFDNETEEYTINVSEKSYTDIANTEVVVYVYDSAVKKKDKYIVSYKKYVVSNPYEVLNYYDNLEEEYDTTKILDYLKGKEKVNVIKSVVTPSMVDSVADYEKTVKVTYILKNNKLLIESVA